MAPPAHGTEGYDTALARLLHTSGRVPLPELQEALRRVREARPGVDLSSVLASKGLVGADELETTWRPVR